MNLSEYLNLGESWWLRLRLSIVYFFSNKLTLAFTFWDCSSLQKGLIGLTTGYLKMALCNCSSMENSFIWFNCVFKIDFICSCSKLCSITHMMVSIGHVGIRRTVGNINKVGIMPVTICHLEYTFKIIESPIFIYVIFYFFLISQILNSLLFPKLIGRKL